MPEPSRTPSRTRRALFIRLDRIGDLVLTLPVDESLRDTRVEWWIPPGLKFIAEHASPPRPAREVGKKISPSDFFKLWREVRSSRYDLAVVFHAPWWVSFLLWLARVPARGGVRSQWHSFLFFNRGIRQKRSRAEFSELEYNFQLIEDACVLPRGQIERHSLRLQAPAESDALARNHLSPANFVVVHPGMGGSALNWPNAHYADLIRLLSSREKVVVTGTSADAAFLDPLKKNLAGAANVIWLDDRLSGPELLSVLANARAVVAPSTGVLHLAASTGVSTVGIFSPVRVQHPRRWGPQGARVKAHLPPVTSCPGEMSCLGAACPQFDCMPSLSVGEIAEALGQFHENAPRSSNP